MLEDIIPDHIIRNGLVIDGSGTAGVKADIAIAGDRIVAIGDLAHSDAVQVTDASGLVVAPGFIDVHTHDDAALIIRPDMEAKLSQGVTTVICGNCGISGAPYDLDREPPGLLRLVFKSEEFVAPDLASYMAKVDAAQPSVNSAFLTGHTTLRMNAMGEDLDRPATPDEIDYMKRQLAQALRDGSIGLSTGLFYDPAHAAPTEEVVALASVLADYDGIYTTHMRDEADHVVESVEESLYIGASANVPVVISHHKCQGKQNFGRSAETLKIMAAARKTQSVALDIYPYEACSTVLNETNVMGALRTIVTWSDPHPEMSGRDLDDIADELGLSPLEAMKKLMPGGAIYFMMDEADIDRIMTSENAMIGSDGLPEDAHPHPRLWGTFPRVLGHYVREKQLMPLYEAVHRMTGLSAGNFMLKDRGLIMPSYYADITIFDPDTVIDKATYEKPKQYASGIEVVIVNGQIAWQNGSASNARAGKVLKRTAA
ncbi:N-acyl-D-amino-acid deacylase family protein [Candidatus Puniceispirillum marinum]|uniref:N-acyl-D-amino acid deacylase family protein n=1 Tax=Puniceispirillum marinum (strain IMCC1322) TaxID=488538 RepID=D5BNC3_PUNMI|nr:D-aminoacylase [Candidatus Puniceispirillum marinum]ADE40316.1 N-acyl-D-amino acid deacylase family protein [Candidatus Puniceispirillum marinum IMCC1322]